MQAKLCVVGDMRLGYSRYQKNRAHKNVTRDRYVGRLTGDIDIIVVVVMVEEEGPRER